MDRFVQGGCTGLHPGPAFGSKSGDAAEGDQGTGMSRCVAVTNNLHQCRSYQDGDSPWCWEHKAIAERSRDLATREMPIAERFREDLKPLEGMTGVYPAINPRGVDDAG